MQDFQIKQLKTFVAINEAGGFHAATNHLHKTQPAISLTIKSLENNLGQALFEKNSHAKLTPFGRYFLKYAQALVNHHDEIKSRLEQGLDNDNLSVSIATLPSVAQHLMPQYLKEFYTLHPSARIKLRDTGSSRIQKLLKEHKIDIAIGTIHDIAGDFNIKQIAQDKMGVVCHRDHPITQLQSLTWGVISKYRPIANGTWDILPHRQYEMLLRESKMTIANMSSLNAVLQAKLGVTVLPALAYAGDSDLVFLPLKHPTVYRQIGVIKDNNKELSAMAVRFFDYLIAGGNGRKAINSEK